MSLEITDLDDSEIIVLNDGRGGNKPRTPDRPSPSNSASSNGRRRVSTPLQLSSQTLKKKLLSGIFGVDGDSYDVVLYSTHLVMTAISGRIKGSVGKKMSVMKVNGDRIEIYLKDLFGVQLRRAKSKSKKMGTCQGVELHTYSEKDANTLRHEIITLTHPSEDTSKNWVDEIDTVLQTITGRPKHAKLYRDTADGTRNAYNTLIYPIFFGANLNTVNVEQGDAAKVIKDIENTDFSLFHCVLVAGGDSMVNTVVDALLKKVQFDNGIVLGGKEALMSSTIPIGVLPLGVSNVIAHTVHGTSDMVTAALNIIYGRTLMSDILSVTHSQGNLYKFAFSAQYGFGSTVMKTVNKSKMAHANRYQIAIAKGLTKSKLRPYCCEVKYRLAHSNFGEPLDGRTCREGCTVCNNDSSTPCPDGTNYSDPLQDFSPLELSNTSSQMSDLAAGEYDATKGEYLSISVYATSSPCDMAPLGLSKYTHIADGCLDLVMVHSTERKEFMRFLKRNGNTKNQLDFPFVESYRLKEVSFHVRMPVGWSYRDKDYSEIVDQARLQKNRTQSSAADETIKVIADGDSAVIATLQINDSDSSDLDDCESASSETSQITNSAHIKGSSKETNSAPQKMSEGYVHAIHKYTDNDRRVKRRKRKEMEKEMKAKDKEEKTIKSVWYLDSCACTETTDLTIRVLQKMVTFYGSGMSAQTHEPDVFCFPAV